MAPRTDRAKKNMPDGMFFTTICLYILQLSYFDVNGIQAFFTALDVEFHFVVFTDLVDETGSVYKNVFATFIGFNEAKPFGFIKKFYSSCLHCLV